MIRQLKSISKRTLFKASIFIIVVVALLSISITFKSGQTVFIETIIKTPISHKIQNDYSLNENTKEADSIISAFLTQNKIVGASVAITKDGRLIFAKGYGYADKENYESVEPRHMFRIASVSKLITAVAVMHLIEEYKLSLNTKVFGPNGILNDSSYLNYTDNRIEEITIYNLLTHTSGWSGALGDPIFNYHLIAEEMNVPLPISLDDIIQYALTKQLVSEPGKTYLYSNLGFCILGEVIKKVSGSSYENYVRQNVLEPIGIYEMRLGHSFINERVSNEVKYYEAGRTHTVLAYNSWEDYVPEAYGGNDIELLGAAGGWIASSVELIKLVVAIDGFQDKEDILSKATIDMMVVKDRHSKSLIGWKGKDSEGNWWRTGTLTGTTALVMRQKDNINWVVLLNTTPRNHGSINYILTTNMTKALGTIDSWPKYDLFSNFTPDIAQTQPFNYEINGNAGSN
jgi:CubicO group peptidase (beta-lactamase class C family)